jgi:hypothetical protein
MNIDSTVRDGHLAICLEGKLTPAIGRHEQAFSKHPNTPSNVFFPDILLLPDHVLLD